MLGRRHAVRFGPELDQGQRIATRRLQQPSRQVRREAARAGSFQQLRGRRLVEAVQPEVWQARGQQRRLLALSNRDQDGDGIRDQPARREADGLRRGAVEPLRVVDRDQQRRFVGVGRDQPEGRGADDQAVCLGPRTEAQ